LKARSAEPPCNIVSDDLPSVPMITDCTELRGFSGSLAAIDG
jgi:hypothetical protein